MHAVGPRGVVLMVFDFELVGTAAGCRGAAVMFGLGVETPTTGCRAPWVVTNRQVGWKLVPEGLPSITLRCTRVPPAILETLKRKQSLVVGVAIVSVSTASHASALTGVQAASTRPDGYLPPRQHRECRQHKCQMHHPSSRAARL
jgi:hypothetical protein